MAEAERALQIGAGNIGRGLLGPVYAEAGLRTTFADVNERQVKELNGYGEYPVFTVSAEGAQESLVGNVDAVDIRDPEAFSRAVVEADVITTAVGPDVLPRVAPALAAGLVERLKRRPSDELHVAVVACENVTDNTARLKEHIWAHLTPEQQARLEGIVSFPNCAVDRIVPTAGVSAEPLAVTVEDYYQLVIDAAALRQPIPAIPGMKLSEDLDAVLEQKLFTLNTVHALTAYYGHKAGYEYIHEAIQDPTIRSLVEGTLTEIEPLLTERHDSISAADQQAFADQTVERFANPYLRDTVTRVGREPMRKLGADDRLVAPALLLVEQGGTPAHLTVGIVAALKFRHPADPQAVELARRIPEETVPGVLQGVSGLSPEHPVSTMAKAAFELDELGQVA